MTFKEFKNTDEYKNADILEVFNEDGFEFAFDHPEADLESMNVVECEIRGGYVSVVLKR